MIRDALVAALHADLIGPFVSDEQAAEQEILPIAPSRWYLTGFLAPQGGRAPDADDADSAEESLGAGDEKQSDDAGVEEPEAKRPVRFPASMGLSVFLPKGEGDSLEVELSYADYDRVEFAEDRDDKIKHGWKRVPHGPVVVAVPLDAAKLDKRVLVPGSRGLVLQGELRTTDMDGLAPGTRVLSLFLVNDRAAVEGPERDRAFVFQVRMRLRFEAGFVPRPNRRGEDADDTDQRVLALMFRDHVEWAVGHNTSVERPEVSGGKVRELRTTQLPCHEVPAVRARQVPDVMLGMLELGKLEHGAAVAALSPLVEAYGDWIHGQKSVFLDRDGLSKTRDQLVHEAELAKQRIAAGIDLLKDTSRPEILRAFRYANQAMHVQALQADKARGGTAYKEKQPSWYPFQLAFLLMNLASVADPSHEHRDTAELIYFPTGGGKTEAYLGLIAFTILLRRLRGQSAAHEGRGVAVLLRYTLRLLTLDQLARAATLICALERLRHGKPRELGNARIAVGLWVGASASANRLADVKKALADASAGQSESPFPLTACPWCGDAIKVQNIKLVDASGKPVSKGFTRAAVYCGSVSCDFNESKSTGAGLPVLFVDEQIYDEVPAFIVATVDKFAMLPWRGDAGLLFGQATHLDDSRVYGVMDSLPLGARPLPKGLLAPELVVQDELHLISGPLGTMVGLYEAAIAQLCERDGPEGPRKAKIVCSTATVRRAREQIRALFDRPMALFPPRGIDQGDNFFARVDTSVPGRLYLGVGAPGRALRALSVRSFAALLAAAQAHVPKKGAPSDEADSYMTLVGYFNSLRELGGMRRLVEDEVRNRVARVESEKRPRNFHAPHPWARDRSLRLPAELTSRESTAKVKDTKQQLATRFGVDRKETLDVVLASNMISVGLDVPRLGLMVVTGQPKTTSEYIQATSRVGRASPGLVVTCLNVARPRDRSHYERFVHYHDSFYREVEATSVTPFSAQALDRGLVGALLAMVRHAVLPMGPPLALMNIHAHRAEADALLEALMKRARSHRSFADADAEKRLGDFVGARGRNVLDAWERLMERAKKDGTTRIYSKLDRAGHEGKPLLYTANDPEPDDHDAKPFHAPMSMRDVEPSVHVWLRFAQLDERG